MTKHWLHFFALAIVAAGAVHAKAGTLFYVPIPATQSDVNSGISADSGYTSAVDSGNTHGTDRIINGITLYALTGSGQTSTADNCTLNALSGSLSNGGGKSASIQADGALGEALSDMTFNNGATDNSQQEIVLDPESLEAGTTYDLRIYVCNSSGQNRQVSLSFVGDGQAAVETGWFNEDDARTSAGGFKEASQVYYIDYRYTWDGDSTPGITITQKSGSAPFCLYALTNQVVPAGAAEGGASDQGARIGMVNAESDEVGVSSDEFYTAESLNTNGRWVDLDKWGKCWQPTTVTNGWCPYTNGRWSECDDCGWTFVSEEPWAWCCYHYGRWCKVKAGCGWAWVPGKVWAASWVSWRKGRDESCSCIGWAPLPPQASCELNVGISTWVDQRCDIGPECYTFVNVRDFGSDSYFGCGCIYEHSRNVTIIIETINITNIYFGRHATYCGGPDFNWCNERIRKFGGKEVTKIFVNRIGDPGKLKGGKFSHLEGNQLALLTPHVKGDKNPKHAPKVAEHLGADKIDKGWSNVKDKKLEKQVRNHIAEENKGKNAKMAKATLPANVADQMGKHHAGGDGQHPGKGNKSVATDSLTTGSSTQHPGGKGRNKDQLGNTGVVGPSNVGGTQTKDQHPGSKGHEGKNAIGGANDTTGMQGNTGNVGAGSANTATGKRHHPGQKLKTSNNAPSGSANLSTGANDATGTQGNASGITKGGKHPGKHKGSQPTNQTGNQLSTGGSQVTTQSGGDATGQGGGGKSHHKGQQQSLQNQNQVSGQSSQNAGESSSPGAVHHKKSSQQQYLQNQNQGPTSQNSGGNAGQGKSHTQQLQSNQFQQQQYQQQGGGKKKKGTPTPTPH